MGWISRLGQALSLQGEIGRCSNCRRTGAGVLNAGWPAYQNQAQRRLPRLLVMTHRPMALNFIVLGVAWTQLIAAPHWSNFPGSNFRTSPGAVTLCGRVQAT